MEKALNNYHPEDGDTEQVELYFIPSSHPLFPCICHMLLTHGLVPCPWPCLICFVTWPCALLLSHFQYPCHIPFPMSLSNILFPMPLYHALPCPCHQGCSPNRPPTDWTVVFWIKKKILWTFYKQRFLVFMSKNGSRMRNLESIFQKGQNTCACWQNNTSSW